MASQRKNGYKFSDTAFGAYIESEKERVGKFRFLGLIFGVLFGVPLVFLVFGVLWKAIKWIFSIG
jgi:hypothetical protein